MKKIIFILLITFILPISVNANEISSTLNCNKTKIKIGETFECSLFMTSTEEINNFKEKINYESKYLSITSVKGVGEWNSRSNVELDIYKNDSTILENEEVAKITFKAKGTTETGKINISIGNETYKEINSFTMKIISNDNYLSKLYIKGYSLSFKKDVDIYDITLTEDKAYIGAVLNDTRSTFEKDFGPREVPLKLGKNTVYVKVKSESGNVRTYTINITKVDKRSTNCDLKSLSVEGYKLDKTFDKNILDYSIIVSNDTKKINVLAELENEKAKFNQNNKPGEYELINDTTKINIQVKAENDSVKTYTITVTKQKDNNNLLKSITLSNGVIDFKPSIYEYNINVANNIEKIEVKATPQSEDAKVEIDNIEKLEIGKNTIKIRVTGSDNNTKEYILYINRISEEEVLSSNTRLKELKIKGYDIKFNSDTHEYKLIIKSEHKLDITAISEDENSTITIVGNKELKEGSIIKIFVTSEDTSQAVYTINIEKSKTIIYIILIMSAILLVAGIVLLIISKKKKQENKSIDLALEVDDKKRLILK